MDADRAQMIAANRARLMAAVAMPNTVPTADVGDLLRPTACPRCDYALTGLPAAGACPECGRAYGTGEVFLYGHAPNGNAGSLRPRSRRELTVLWGLGVAVLTGLALLALRTPFVLWSHFVWWGPNLLIALVTMTWRSTTDQGSGVVQVRLAADGCRQGVRGTGPVPYEKADAARPVPWAKVRAARVTPEGEGLIRLRLSSTDAWWKLQVDHVHAVVRCPAEAVEPLRRRIAAWREDRR